MVCLSGGYFVDRLAVGARRRVGMFIAGRISGWHQAFEEGLDASDGESGLEPVFQRIEKEPLNVFVDGPV